MSTTNGEKDSLLGQTVLPPELGQILGGLVFFCSPFMFVYSFMEPGSWISPQVLATLIMFFEFSTLEIIHSSDEVKQKPL